MSLKESIASYIKDKFDIKGERVFEKYPKINVFRHKDNQKWFAIILSADAKSLDFSDEARQKFKGEVELLNLKCDPSLAYLLHDQIRIIPAYHMSKKHWVSINLNSDISKEQVFDLIDESFTLSAKKSKRSEKR
ncbi:MmcQ/YjbR family DNA-binding protein [Campylobacter sp. RM12920]|uniref:MmcQ/YjbR family DNA-binding protein n=1 Tax=Campylobacter californiensis TaxID=1032243 RepID=A0ABD4JI82_9BACT|nr:MmcQ/YjbR family DNA-binding protein [Campylobacter sp. RM9328]MBE2986443.1 MmcQ/YjbR family DNA-binding protein [Campylobacter sp. RM12919]MBE2987842.1 MmcQ/YjbR family DNA-binding protein [Campylobacter sp. RM12920]